MNPIADALSQYFRLCGPTAALLLAYGVYVLATMYEIAVHRLTHAGISKERAAYLRGALSRAASHASILGLLGTFIGLTMGLSRLSDPTGIGTFIANALVSTLVGSVCAYLAELGIWLVPEDAR